MKEYENFEMLKKKFSPLLFIFRKDEENEIKKYTKKCTLVNIIKNYNGQNPTEYTSMVENRSNIFMKNKFVNYFEKPLGIFNRFYSNNNFSEKMKLLNANNINRNNESAYPYNRVLNRNILNSKYFPNILNNNIARYEIDEETDFADLEEDYVVVKKVYTYLREFESMYMYIY
ncbi:hypothetical protein, conserved [Plasmodium gonderi]|uniref:Uncharacterized protein n=1 Tax=Plasmodium gonderi TaxID=77519 RepID=A0A1Y1J9T8_PLAGO|nr:hypothetical protein, conserved [Plasmodium gonderi]GAW79259.1 hypothetical protein, conserved [Plasmodium gonderi]